MNLLHSRTQRSLSHRNTSIVVDVTTSYRAIIKRCLADRIRINPSYSMRSFSRDLGLAPSTLSEILNERKGCSQRTALKIAKAMRLPDWEKSLFLDLVIVESSKSKSQQVKASERIKEQSQRWEMEKLRAESQKALTSLLDLAILECTHLRDFEANETWLARRLRVEIPILTDAVKRLVECKLLGFDEHGRWKDLSPYFTTTDGVSKEFIRNFHRETLRNFETRLDSEPVEDRVMKSVVFSIDEAQLQEARRILDEALAKVIDLSSRGNKQKDHVMTFSTQLFFLAKGGT